MSSVPSARSLQQKTHRFEQSRRPHSREQEATRRAPGHEALSRVFQSSAALLFLPQVRRAYFPVFCRGAVSAWLHMPASEITDIAARFAVLEQHQKGNDEDRNAVLENQVCRHSGDVSPYKSANNVHHGGCSEHDKKVFEFEIHEGHPRL